MHEHSNNPFLIKPQNFIIPDNVVKRPVKKPDFDSLKEGQKKAVSAILDYLVGANTQEHKAMLLRGYAGTGKTFVNSFIVEYLLTKGDSSLDFDAVFNSSYKIAVTAPTNKAVKVCERMAEYEHPDVKYMTIHKLLGLKEKINPVNGKITFEKEWGKESELSNYDLLIIDETSMVPDDLFLMIYADIEVARGKLLMIGDGFQIPPVGKDDCIPFKPSKQKELKIGVAILDEIVRQTNGSPIIELATAIRERQPGALDIRTSVFSEYGNLYFLPKTQKEQLYQICDNYFNNEFFKAYPDYMKVIAYRNDTVNAINAKVRNIIYGEGVLPKIKIGEKLVADAPITYHGGDKILYTTNDEFEVVDFKIESRLTYKSKDVEINCKYYDVTTKNINGDLITIAIIHESEEPTLNAITKMLKDRALSVQDPSIRKWVWKTFFEVDRHFAKVKYNYAITGHKSQGSSFQNCMVLMWDIMQNFKKLEAERILYVALTRPRHNLCIIN
jgi:ATP-dependent exoDNAse (exonuclease V) alpha subunit